VSDAEREVERQLRDDLDGIRSAQAELLALVDDLMREPDQGRQNEIVRRIGDRSEALRLRCEELEARARRVAKESRGFVEVVLTPDQRRVVEERTGQRMESVRIADDSGGIARAMESMPREQVLDHAVAEGQRRAREDEARRAAREELDRVREDLRHAPEQIRREMERMMEDPDFKRAFDRVG
jgi:polyhydroxyalkanoate synthesis regulator phasin